MASHRSVYYIWPVRTALDRCSSAYSEHSIKVARTDYSVDILKLTSVRNSGVHCVFRALLLPARRNTHRLFVVFHFVEPGCCRGLKNDQLKLGAKTFFVSACSARENFPLIYGKRVENSNAAHDSILYFDISHILM